MKCGYVTLIGSPNVGKSTLMNALVGQKLSIASSRPQTTRQRILGIFTSEDAQLIFLDTPGFLEPKYLLQTRMASQIESAIADADALVVLLDLLDGAELPKRATELLLRRRRDRPMILALNKADLADEADVARQVDVFRSEKVWNDVIPVSALRKRNIDVLLGAIVACMPEQPAFYPKDLLSDHPERFFAAEFIREQIFLKYQEEIPYATAVEIREFKERTDGKTYIAADIIVERDSQKGILIGKGGSALRSVGVGSRRTIEEFLGREVFLELFVKVRSQWRKSEHYLDQLGYRRSDS